MDEVYSGIRTVVTAEAVVVVMESIVVVVG